MSYCHADQSWAAWLHKSLESYRVPKRLVGASGLHGTVPARLAPIFRDREELSSSSDLSVKIKEALGDSESLLLICSPAAARSKWVNEEIRYFRSLGRTRIYCVIVDGDPNPSDPAQLCFPEALLEREGHQLAEPLAADVRAWADGKSLAKLKLVAGLAGVRLDELRQRDKQRSRRIKLGASLAIAVAISLIGVSIESRLAEINAQIEKEAQRDSAEIMLKEFIEQCTRLADIADLETRKAFEQVLSSYLAQLDPADLTIESRRQLGVVLSQKGARLREEGQLDQAMEAFKSARETLQSLVDELQSDEQAMYELGQAEYWIGQVHLDMGQMEEAAVSFNAYAHASRALHDLRPENAKYTMEVCYAQTNLGNLEDRRVPSDPGLVLELLQSALNYNEEAASQDSSYERELAESHAYLADAWLGVCDLEQAMLQRQINVELAAREYNLHPVSNTAKKDYVYALSGMSGVQRMTGRLASALESLQQALSLQKELVDEDPENLNKQWILLKKSAYRALYLELSGHTEESWKTSLAIEAGMREVLEQDQYLRIDSAIAYGVFLRDFAYRAYRKGEVAFAGRLLAESIQHLEDVAQQHPDNKGGLQELALAYFYYWSHNNATLPDDSASAWLAMVQEASSLQSCTELNIASRLAVMTGDNRQAQNYVSRLLRSGYNEPEFKRFCSEYGLCLFESQ